MADLNSVSFAGTGTKFFRRDSTPHCLSILQVISFYLFAECPQVQSLYS